VREQWREDDDVQLVVFKLADEMYGVHVLAVEEIIRYQEVTSIPHAPPAVEGVINLRGRIIPVLDLRKRFGLPPAERAKGTRIVVVEASGLTVGLVVDAVDEVRNLPTDTIEPPSPIITTVHSEFVMGVGKLTGDGDTQQLVILLDLDRVAVTVEADAMAALPKGEDSGNSDEEDGN